MKLSRLIEIFAQYLQEHGDVEFMYSDKERNLFEVEDMEINIEERGLNRKILVLDTNLIEDPE